MAESTPVAVRWSPRAEGLGNSTRSSPSSKARTEPTRQEVHGRIYGVNLVDRHSGKVYYYDFETSESKWGTLPNSPAPSPRLPDGEADGLSADEGALVEFDARTAEHQGKEWIRLVDSQGREYEYNRRTCASRWLQ